MESDTGKKILKERIQTKEDFITCSKLSVSVTGFLDGRRSFEALIYFFEKQLVDGLVYYYFAIQLNNYQCFLSNVVD